jgi:precorrin-2 dehydrogenase/sirohydrochlorin ferrochelatase
MRYYPLFADLNGRTCLLIGEGKMAEEKSASLQKSGAVVRRRNCFSEEDAQDVFLIVADVEEDLARQIQAFGERNRVFVNIVDKPKYCSFIVPAIVQQSDLQIAISTSGRSPALAGWIRERMQEEYGPEYSSLLDALGETREDVKKGLRRYGDRKAFYRELLESGILQIAQCKGKEAVRHELNRRLREFKRTLLHQART